jgi:two-component system phosphate regulon sensor histidine kinase PhoR
MHSSLRKIGLLILAIIILPVITFSIFEIGNLRQNEKVIQDIYKNQLDAILFSINTYSDDMISNFASRIENSLNSFKPDTTSELDRLLSENPSIISLMQFDATLKYLSSTPYSNPGNLPLSEITSKLHENTGTINRLQTYMRGGYRKIETLDSTIGNIQWLIFITHVNNQLVFNVLAVDPEKFISHVLDPKIQEIAKGKFHIVAYRLGEDLPFYSSNKQYNPGKIEDKKSFWLLKNYLMGIELKDITIADLARERIRKNLLLIGIMDIILLFGAWLIFRNIKKQVELSQLKSDFVSGVSHEIRTPLALISMYIETLEMGRVKNAEKVKEYYSVILNETSRLSGIVNRILSFSQIENNKRKYVLSETNLNEIVENSALSFRYTIENKGFKYSFEPDKELPLIMADQEAIADAFVNLIDNAMKYSIEQKDITVRTGRTIDHAFIEVEDKGIGISEKNQKYIFDRFYRVTEKNLANRVKGSGLGLAIVKHIIDAHKGDIYVKSSPGSGSLFRLLFPIK